jgi:hypothetical protein
MTAPTLKSEGFNIRVTRPVYERLEQMRADRQEDLRRRVTVSEVIEQLLADQWTERTP